MIELFVFVVQNVHFAVPIEYLTAVQDKEDFTTIDRKDGIIRNTVYSVLNMGEFLYNERTESGKYLLVEQNSKRLALNVDDVEGIIEIDENAKIAVSPLLKHSHILYHVRNNGILINVVDLEDV